jgi:hypothetical protein
MTVVGVASPRFRGMDIGDVPAVWIPASMKAQATPEWDRLLDRRAGFMQVFGRLRPGVGADEAQAGLQPWFKAMLDEDTRREGFPEVTAEQRAEFLASTIAVRPASLGRSSFRRRMDRPLVRAHGGHAAAAAARIAQRGQPLPRPRRRALSRDPDAPRPRRVAGTDRDPAARGQPARRAGGGRSGTGGRAAGVAFALVVPAPGRRREWTSHRRWTGGCSCSRSW